MQEEPASKKLKKASRQPAVDEQPSHPNPRTTAWRGKRRQAAIRHGTFGKLQPSRTTQL